MTKKVWVGFDIGGTKTECVFLQEIEGPGEDTLSIGDKYLQPILRERIPTEKQSGYTSYLNRVTLFFEQLISKSKISHSTIMGIGVGAPGPICPNTERMLNGGTKMLINRTLKKDLSEKLKIEAIAIENDANCFALAEALFGAGQEYAKTHNIAISKLISMGIILGTGCGGGLIIGNSIYTGAHGAAMEVGHMALHPEDSLTCYCGQRGCAELYISGTGLAKQYTRRSGEQKSSKEILTNTDAPYTRKAIDQYRQNITKFLTNLGNTFDPHVFILGGGLSQQKTLFDGVSLNLEKEVYTPNSAPRIVFAKLGDSAGVFGAAILPYLQQSSL